MTNENHSTTKAGRTYVKYAVVIAVILSLSAFLLPQIQRMRQHSVRINLAGRQRMLTQRITKNVLLSRQNGTSVQKAKNCVRVFDKTLYALTYGGKAPTNLLMQKKRSLPPTNDPDTVRKLEAVLELWSPFKKHVRNYLAEKNTTDRTYVVDRNEELLDRMDAAVFALQREAQRDYLTALLLAGAVLLFAIGYLVVKLIRNIRALRQASTRIEKLEKILPICSNCNRVRVDESDPYDQNSWVTLERYLENTTENAVSHGLCPKCVKEVYPEYYEKIKDEEGITE